MSSGNHPFSHIVKSEIVNNRNEKAVLNIAGLKEVLNDYKEQFKDTIFIGKRSGFLDEYDTELKLLENDFSNVKVLTVNQAIDQYCEQVKTQIP
jgi:CRISPR-associated protein Cst2